VAHVWSPYNNTDTSRLECLEFYPGAHICVIWHCMIMGTNRGLLDGLGIELRWELDCLHLQTGSRTHPAFYTMGIGSLLTVKRLGSGFENRPPPSMGRDSYGTGRSGDRISVGSEIFRTRPDRHWVPHILLYNGYRVFLGCKAARVEVKERVELYLSSPRSSWPTVW
jgi:hypothetical protein